MEFRNNRIKAIEWSQKGMMYSSDLLMRDENIKIHVTLIVSK